MSLFLMLLAALAALLASFFALRCARVSPTKYPKVHKRLKWNTIVVVAIGVVLLVVATQLDPAYAWGAGGIFLAGILGMTGATMHGHSRRAGGAIN